MKRLLAYSMYEKGDYVGGLKYINKFFGQVEKKKILPSDFEYLGKLQSKNNLDSLAIISFKRSLDMDNTQNDLLGDIGNSYNKQKNYREAANYYSQKIATSKRVVSTDYFFLGRALYFDQQYAKADSAFIKVTEMQPAWPTGYIWRGRCNQQMDTVEPLTYAAKAYFDKAVEVGSKDMVKFKKDLVEAYDYIGKYFIKKDDNSTAKDTFKKILEIDPENQAAKDILKQIK
jgi:tetratricopeptide (TPR) repeat protein